MDLYCVGDRQQFVLNLKLGQPLANFLRRASTVSSTIVSQIKLPLLVQLPIPEGVPWEVDTPFAPSDETNHKGKCSG
jgi:hypothetical protein